MRLRDTGCAFFLSAPRSGAHGFVALCSRLRSPSALRASASTTSISAKVPSYGFLRRAQRRRAHRHPGRSVILTSLMGPGGGLERHPGTAAAARRDGPDHEPGRLRLIPRVLDAPRHLKHAAARLHTDLAVSGASAAADAIATADATVATD